MTQTSSDTPPARRNDRFTYWLLGSATVSATVTATTIAYEGAAIAAAVGALVALAVVGGGLWRAGPHSHDARTNLGAGLLVGVVVAASVTGAELAIDDRRSSLEAEREQRVKRQDDLRAERARRHSERQSLRLSLGLRQRLVAIDLHGHDLRAIRLPGRDFTRAQLDGATLRGAHLERAKLRYANLTSTELQGASLLGADLRHADISFANLTGANLSGADLRGADLTAAELKGARLRGDLRGHDFHQRDLRNVDFVGADLRDADLTEARLVGALLGGANLRGQPVAAQRDRRARADQIPLGSEHVQQLLQENDEAGRVPHRLQHPRQARHVDGAGSDAVVTAPRRASHRLSRALPRRCTSRAAAGGTCA